MELANVAGEAAAVPDRVDEPRVERVGGHRVLVVEQERRGVPDQLDGRPPRQAAVRGSVDVHHRGRVHVGIPDRQRHEIRRPVGGDRDPRGGGTELRAPQARRHPGDPHLEPGAAMQDTGEAASGPAVRPAILLVASDQVWNTIPTAVDVARRDPRLDLAVQDVVAALGSHVIGSAPRERARARNLDKRPQGPRPGPHRTRKQEQRGRGSDYSTLTGARHAWTPSRSTTKTIPDATPPVGLRPPPEAMLKLRRRPAVSRKGLHPTKRVQLWRWADWA